MTITITGYIGENADAKIEFAMAKIVCVAEGEKKAEDYLFKVTGKVYDVVIDDCPIDKWFLLKPENQHKIKAA